MNQQVDQSVTNRNCVKCNDKIYTATLTCPSCKNQSDACIITGYPITSQSNRVSCTNCNNVANKAAWNLVVAATGKCPWCNAPQKPIY